jgi:serine/threonine protein kinase
MENNLQSDLWSVGVILFQLVTGKLPFPGSNYFQVCKTLIVLLNFICIHQQYMYHLKPPLCLLNTAAPKHLGFRKIKFSFSD